MGDKKELCLTKDNNKKQAHEKIKLTKNDDNKYTLKRTIIITKNIENKIAKSENLFPIASLRLLLRRFLIKKAIPPNVNM